VPSFCFVFAEAQPAGAARGAAVLQRSAADFIFFLSLTREAQLDKRSNEIRLQNLKGLALRGLCLVPKIDYILSLLCKFKGRPCN